ncbi:hypothetical protein AB5N19_12672 [Seiridium cardinale]|uniref:Uncharacterized protein n=1 Tax=Seiridium cardinale TaxID=138064 RepID=A0ABR2X8C4_9PEZI
MGSGRSSKKAGKAPAPLLPSSFNNVARRHDSFGSDSSYSNDWEFEHHRESSSSPHKDRITPSRKSTSGSTKSTKPTSPTVNRHTHCGRHSDQWLFGGFSDVIKSAWKKE